MRTLLEAGNKRWLHYSPCPQVAYNLVGGERHVSTRRCLLGREAGTSVPGWAWENGPENGDELSLSRGLQSAQHTVEAQKILKLNGMPPPGVPRVGSRSWRIPGSCIRFVSVLLRFFLETGSLNFTTFSQRAARPMKG